MSIESVTIDRVINGWVVKHNLGPTFVFHDFGKVLEHLKKYFKYPKCDGA